MNHLLNEIINRSGNKLKYLLGYSESALMGMLQRKEYRSLQHFCLFVGYGRSGHTLIASLLNAHPEIVLGIEWGVFVYANLGYKKRQIFYSLIKNSREYSERRENVWTGYSYKVPDSWQGKYNSLKVIGDKHAGTNSLMLSKDPNLLDKTAQILGMSPLIIHPIRNPFDNITTITIRRNENLDAHYKPKARDLLPFIDLYFRHADVLMRLKAEGKYKIADIHHEDLISNPKETLSDILGFLGLEGDDSYIRNCASILYEKPHQSRHRIKWPMELIQFMDNEMKKYPFLERYSFDN